MSEEISAADEWWHVYGSVEPFEADGIKYDRYEYMGHHRPDARWNKRRLVDGFHVNPRLPDQFFGFPNAMRPRQEVEDWRCKPFIKAEIRVVDGEIFNIYHVCCLDGGAWDRPTDRGSFRSSDEAIKLCKKLVADGINSWL